jgi:flagellar biosynthesis/type III secretory pathway chaperone
MLVNSILIASQLHAQNYNVALIPDSLTKNAHMVKRMEELHVTIKSLNKVIVTNKYAITILDEQGEEASGYVNAYSSMRDLSSIEGNLYDANGKKLKSVKKKDITDAPAFRWI